MKHLLVLLLLAPATCLAQNFEIGLNGGVTIHTKPQQNQHTRLDKVKAGYAASAKVNLLLPHTQIGIGVDIVSATETNALVSPYTSSETNYLAKPLIVPHAFYNLVHHSAKGYVYAGVMAGLAIATMGVNTYEYTTPVGGYISGYTTAYTSVIGFAGGLQTGFVSSISKKVSINMEAALRYVNYNYTDPTTTLADNPYRYRYFYIPFTAGIRYRI